MSQRGDATGRKWAFVAGIFVFLLGFAVLAADMVLFTTDYGISARFKAALGAVSACGAALATIVGLLGLMRSAMPPADGQENRRLLTIGRWAVIGLVIVSGAIVWVSVRFLPEPQAPQPSPGLAARATATSVVLDWLPSPDDTEVK